MSSIAPFRSRQALLPLLICLIATGFSAQAQVVQFANRTLYNAATTGNTIVDFTGHIQSLAPSISIAPDTFSGLNGSQVEVIDGFNLGQTGNARICRSWHGNSYD